MEVKVSKANRSEITELNQISITSKAHWGYPKEWLDKWMDDLKIKESDFSEHKVYKIESKREIFGFCVITELPGNYEILHLWILPEYIGKGFGKKLLLDSLDMVIKEPKPVIVEADPNAEAFYASQGFVTFDHIESYPKGRVLPVMKKEVT